MLPASALLAIVATRCGCALWCQAHAERTIVERSECIGLKPSTRRAASGLATRIAGSPARRACRFTGTERPVSARIASRTCFTE